MANVKQKCLLSKFDFKSSQWIQHVLLERISNQNQNREVNLIYHVSIYSLFYLIPDNLSVFFFILFIPFCFCQCLSFFSCSIISLLCSVLPSVYPLLCLLFFFLLNFLSLFSCLLYFLLFFLLFFFLFLIPSKTRIKTT